MTAPYSYEGPTVASSGLTLGAHALRRRLALLTGRPLAEIGGYNRRCVVQCGGAVAVGSRTCVNGHGISLHAEGRAVDVMTTDPALHEAVIGWMTTPEALAYGVQEVISGYWPSPGNDPLAGTWRWSAPSRLTQYAGAPHREHVHLSITIAAAVRPGPIPPAPPPTTEASPMFRIVRLFGWNDARLIAGADVITPEPGGPGLQELVNAGMIADAAGAIRPGTPWNEMVTVLTSRAAWNLTTRSTPTLEPKADESPRP